jgi:hypothetical protein
MVPESVGKSKGLSAEMTGQISVKFMAILIKQEVSGFWIFERQILLHFQKIKCSG